MKYSTILLFHKWENRFREGNQFAKGHTTRKWLNQKLNLSFSDATIQVLSHNSYFIGQGSCQGTESDFSRTSSKLGDQIGSRTQKLWLLVQWTSIISTLPHQFADRKRLKSIANWFLTVSPTGCVWLWVSTLTWLHLDFLICKMETRIPALTWNVVMRTKQDKQQKTILYGRQFYSS